MVTIQSAGISDIGKKRKRNEDSFLIDDNLKLYVVADGMGGHRAGEVASNLVVATIHDYMKNNHVSNDFHKHNKADDSLSVEANQILSGIQVTNRAVYDLSNKQMNYRGMGSTISLLHFNDNTLIVANVGDSPIYLIHKGKIELLSVPHTVLAEHAAIDPIGARQLGAKFRHMLTRAVGTEENVQTDVCEIQYYRNDIMIIGSDGLTDLVQPDEILDIVSKNQTEKACKLLVSLANERGGNDNITVIVIKILKDNNYYGIMGFFSRISELFNQDKKS